MRVRASIASITASLKEDGAQLRQRVAAIVADAENGAAESQRLSASAIAASRIWLLLIAISTLVIAGLIVWLFVYRYVVSRSMLWSKACWPCSRQSCGADPAAGPDELGEMSRAQLVFRDNARGSSAARDQAIEARAEAEAASHAKSSLCRHESRAADAAQRCHR